MKQHSTWNLCTSNIIQYTNGYMTDKQKNKEMEKRVVHFHNTQATKLKSKSYAVTCHINEEMSKSTTQYQIPVEAPTHNSR